MLTKTNNIQLIKSLDDEIFGSSSYKLETYQIMLKSNDFFLISIDDINIGFIIIQRIASDYELIKVGMLPSYRQKGLTYGALLELLGTLEYENFLLELKSTNTQALNLYQKLGFEINGHRKNYYSNGVDAILMIYKRD